MAETPDDFLKSPAAADPSPLSEAISRNADMAGVPQDIAVRLVRQESSFNPRAKSPAGAMGLTQLMPDTAKMLGVSDPFNPADNLAGGFKYLASLKKQFGDWSTALAAYNWGPGNVSDWLKRGADTNELPSETRAYVSAIAPNGTPAGETVRHHRHIALMSERVHGEQPQNFLKSQSGEQPQDFLKSTQPVPSPSPTQNAQQTGISPADTVGTAYADAYGMPKPGTASSSMEQLGGALQILPILGTGMTMSRLAGHGEFGPEFQQAADIYKKNPAQAADLYGYNAKPADDFALKHAAPGSLEHKSAEFDEKNPAGAGWLTFGEELLDPVNRGVGKVADPAIAPIYHGVMDFLSPFRGIAQAAGHRGASAVRAWVSRMRAPVGDVEKEVEDIFGGLTKEEKIDVMRRSEPAGKGKVTDSKHDLDARAKQYRSLIKKVDAAQKSQPGLLEDSRTFNPDLFHPLAGAFNDPAYGEETNGIIDDLRTLQGGGGSLNVRKGTAGDNGPRKTLSSSGIEPVVRSGLLRDDYDPAAALRRHATRRMQNVEFEKGVRELPKSLRRDFQATDYVDGFGKVLDQPWARTPNETKVQTLQRFIDENHAKYPSGNPMRYELRPQDGMVPASEILPGIGSPALRDSLVHPEFGKFLRSRGGSMLSGEPTKNMSVTLPGHLVGLPNMPKVTLPIGEVLDKYNSAFRSAVIANPLFHPVWNLRENMAAAGEMPIAAVRQTLKTIVGAFTEKGHDWFDGVDSKLFHQASQKSDEYAQAVQQAIHDGATAEMHPTRSVLGQDIATIRTTPNSEKTLGQKFDTALTKARDWNTRKTFGPTGEQAYSVSLYRRLTKAFPNASGAEIGNMVRDSLGAYQDVDPNNPMSRLFFFFPWLRGNTANWLRNFLTRPGYSLAPLEGIRRYNQQAGDPNFSGQNPTKDYEQYAGTKNGSPQYFTYPLPQRVGADIVNAVGSGDPSNMAYETANILRSHATPVVGNILDLFGTVKAGDSNPAMPANYDTIFQKNAPTVDKWKQVAGYFASHDLPIPLAQYAVQDAVRRGYSPEQFVNTLKQAAGMGYPSEKLSTQQNMMASRFLKNYEREFYAAKQSGNTQQQIQAYKQYMAQLRAIGVIR